MLFDNGHAQGWRTSIAKTNVIPPYLDYRYFRRQHPNFSPQILADMSVLSYSDKDFIQTTLAHSVYEFLGFIDVDDTQMFVTRNMLDGNVAFVFRGTQTFDSKDWLTDLHCRLIYEDGIGIHEGFLASWKNVSKAVNGMISGLRSIKRKKPITIFFSGHSLGAALATIAALKTVKARKGLFDPNDVLSVPKDFDNGPQGKSTEQEGLPIEAVLITLGSPRAGDAAFCEAVKSAVVPFASDSIKDCTFADMSYRFVHGEDGVPRVPFEKMSYLHVGKATVLEQMDRPWRDVLVPRKIYDHVPTLYAEQIWGEQIWDID